MEAITKELQKYPVYKWRINVVRKDNTLRLLAWQVLGDAQQWCQAIEGKSCCDGGKELIWLNGKVPGRSLKIGGPWPWLSSLSLYKLLGTTSLSRHLFATHSRQNKTVLCPVSKGHNMLGRRMARKEINITLRVHIASSVRKLLWQLQSHFPIHAYMKERSWWANISSR